MQMGRKNGKSFLAATICNDEATFSGYKYGQIYCTATKKAQAKIVFTDVKKFIESDADLRELYKIKSEEIISKVTKSVIKPLGKDTKTIDGFQPNAAIIDEYHAHKTDQMYKLMQDGQTYLKNALTFAITTAGLDLTLPCYEHYKFCKRVLSGAIRKDTLFVFICEMDEGDDIWDSRNWAKANPLLMFNTDNTLNEEMIRRISEKTVDAREKGGSELVNFKTKILNEWVTVGGESYLNLEKWSECGCEKKLEEMQGKSCFIGIDLSSGGDLTSIALIFPLNENEVYIWSQSYMPSERLMEHEKSDGAPYRQWVQEGNLSLTSGLYGIKTDYKQIINELAKLIETNELEVQGVGYDPHNASCFLSDLENIVECDLTQITQSAKSLNDATQDFKLSVEAGIVKYDKRNELLKWSGANAVLTANSFGEVKIDKQRKTMRIDAIDAIICGWKVYMQNKEDETDGESLLEEWLSITDENNR